MALQCRSLKGSWTSEELYRGVYAEALIFEDRYVTRPTGCLVLHPSRRSDMYKRVKAAWPDSLVPPSERKRI